MTITQSHAGSDHAAARRPDTRDAVSRALLENGRLTAAEIASELGLTAAGVRRHLDQLVADGAVDELRSAPRGARGRPARVYQLTERGRAAFGDGYADLARDAVEEIRRLGGDAAVERFAARRIRAILADVRPASGPDDAARAAADVAASLARAGYVTSVGDVSTGVQLCRHTCPVEDVASRFPAMCAAEHEAVAALVGTHVQQLSTMTGGQCACTTHVPIPGASARAEPLTLQPAPDPRLDRTLDAATERTSS